MEKSLQEFGREMGHIMPRFMRMAVSKMSGSTVTKEVTIPQMAILALLKDGGSCKMSDIAKLLHVTTSASTGIVDRMVRVGLLKRLPDKKDRRIIKIEMTQKGTKLIDDIHKNRQKMIMDLFSRLTSAERDRYLKTVKKLYRIMAEEMKES